MAWTTPRTWVVGEIVTAAEMNAHVRDNTAYLHGDVTPVDLTAGGASYHVHNFAVDTSGAGVTGTAGGGGNPGVAINFLGDIFSIGSANRAWLNSSIVGDTVNRFQVTSVGLMGWGTGALATDTFLSRAAAGQLFVNAKVLEALPAVASGTVPTTFTPALATGLTQRFSVTAGGAATLTVAAPTTPPSSTQSCFMYMRISNTGGGTVTLAWNAIYAAGTTTALPASIATGSNVNILWVWEGTLWRILVVS